MGINGCQPIRWEQYRRRVEQIEEETTLRRSRTGARPLGRDAVLAQGPHLRPAKIKKSPALFVHAVTKAVRRGLWDAYASVVAAYRTAADRLRAGDREAVFPLGCSLPSCRSREGKTTAGRAHVRQTG